MERGILTRFDEYPKSDTTRTEYSTLGFCVGGRQQLTHQRRCSTGAGTRTGRICTRRGQCSGSLFVRGTLASTRKRPPQSPSSGNKSDRSWPGGMCGSRPSRCLLPSLLCFAVRGTLSIFPQCEVAWAGQASGLGRDLVAGSSGRRASAPREPYPRCCRRGCPPWCRGCRKCTGARTCIGKGG